MAAAKGNTNAAGNSGGKEWGKGNRDKAAKLKGLVMDDAIKIMQSKSKSNAMLKQRELVMAKILPTCVPRPIEISGPDGKPIPLLGGQSNGKKNSGNGKATSTK